MSSSVQQFTESSQAQDRRIGQRISPKTLIYVACGESNGGMVLNVSDEGLAVSMAIAVGDDAYSLLNVRMNGLPASIELPGRMAWTTKSKKRAGIQLLDISNSQREQIREWLAFEGVRDVNLLPRAAADETPASPVRVADAVSPMAFAESRSTLLDSFGGTAPETLGPPLPELFASQGDATAADSASSQTPSQGFNDVRTAAFRENEWDLASVAMVPRKKPKPEGLSAFALMLLWIAIPSFGIGILVGRRPLEQWLARGDAVGKSFSRKSPSQTLSSATPDILASGHQADVKFSPEIPANLPINTEPFDNGVLTMSSADGYPRGNSSSPIDAKLLNSMSTQEARAFKNVDAARVASTTSRTKNNLDKNPAIGDGSAAAEIKQPALIPRPVNVTSPGVPQQSGVAPTTVAAPALARSTTTTPPAISTTANSIALSSDPSRDSNVSPVRQNFVSAGVRAFTPPAGVAVSTSATVASPSTSDPTRNAAKGAVSRTSPSTLTATNAPPAGVAPAPATVNPAAVPSVAPNSGPRSAPLSVQPPLRGVLNIARSTDQAFVLKLPAESVSGGQAASVRMQRFVMVPQRGLWHHHNAVAKLKVGELLTQISPEKPDAKIQPRQGDTVTVRAFVDKDGAVRDLKPVSGRFALMPRVMRTVRYWQFDQTLVDGKPVESEVNVTVEYRGAN